MDRPAIKSASRAGWVGWFISDMRLFWARFAVARRWLSQRYMLADPRTVGLFRIVLGTLLTVDCLRHWRVARQYYSNEGVLSNHFHLFHPSGNFNFSLFHSFSTIGEVHVAFALSFVCYFLLLVGYRARLMSVLACIWVTSMDNRLVMVENGGYIVVNLMTFWAIFLPTDRRFSIDALLRSYRESDERSLAQLNKRYRPRYLSQQYYSLVSAIVVFNLALVYAFNVLNKYGGVWRRGETVHYVLHLDRMVTASAVFFRHHLPYPATWLLSHGTLVVEAVILMAIMWPTARLRSRPLAMLLMTMLHGTFGVMMRLGPFSWFLIGWSTLLLQRAHWQLLGRWVKADKVALAVSCYPQHGTSFQLARLLARLDHLDLLSFSEAALPAGDTPIQLFRARLTTATADAPWLTGRAACWAILTNLPAGRVLVPLVRLCTLGLADLMVILLDGSADNIARWFGLRPAAVSATTASDTKPLLAAPINNGPPATPAMARWKRRALRWGREGVLVWLIFCSLSQLIDENKSIPKPLKHKQPKAIQLTLQYLRLYQGWGMFSPNPIQHDGTVAFDALTIDGRRIDPFTGRPPDLYLSDAEGLGLSQIQQDYYNRIRLDHNKAFRIALERHLQHWHEFTGNPNDELVGFDMYWLRDHNPKPHHTKPYEHEKICLHSWRKRGYRAAVGAARLPPRCKVASGNKK